MKNKELLDIYSDYLISAFGQTTGTGLAGLLGNSISHNRIPCWHKNGWGQPNLARLLNRPIVSRLTIPAEISTMQKAI